MTTDEFLKNARASLHRLPSATPHKGASGALLILVILAVFYTIYFCRTILMPLSVAAFFALVLSPLVSGLTRMKIPKLVACAAVMVVVVAAFGYVASLLVEPAGRWLNAVPVLGERLAYELDGATESLEPIKDSVISGEQAEGESMESVVDSTLLSMFASMAQGALTVAIQVAITVVVAFFFLMFGEDLMRNVVKAQESFSNKRMTVMMFQAMREDISYYFLVITVINLLLGVATACVMALLGVDDPLLWGALAALLNFAPYVGPLILTVILAGVGLMEAPSLSEGLLVPGSFVVLNLLEGQFITPALLGRRFDINPLLVVAWMFLWSWLWGAVGLLTAIPLLMCIKIMAKHMGFLGDWIHVLGGVHKDIHHEHEPRPS